MTKQQTNSLLTPKQQQFCLEYLKDFNGTQAAIRAGYSKKTANEQAARMLANVSIQNYIRETNSTIQKSTIMDVQEIQERLTKVARGDLEEDVVVVLGDGEGYSTAKVVKKQIGAKDQVRALELLGKANSLFVDKIQNLSPPQIVDDIPPNNIGDWLGI